MTDQRPLVEKVLDLVLYAPAGLVARTVTDLPTMVADGRARLENQVKVAHWIGEMAVTTGRKELAKRLRPQPSASASAPVGTAQTDESTAPVQAVTTTSIRKQQGLAPTLPFAGYDELAAAQIVQLLARVPHADLVLIRDYESVRRARRTILNRIDQLLGD